MQADVKYELEDLRPNLFIQETEDSWEKIAKALQALIKLCENGAYDTNPTDLVGMIKAAYRPIVSAMNSERTRLCLIPMDLMAALAAAMGMEFEQLLPMFLPALLTNCARTNKVVVNRAKSSILAVIESSQLASVLTYFLQNIKDKSSSMKIVIAEGTLACLNSCNPPDVEKEARAVEVEAIIRNTARDANADVRKLSKKIYESYTLLLPSRVQNFTAPLSPTTKKYLNIKSATTATTSSESLQKSTSSLRPSSNPRLESKAKPSSSTTSKPTHSRSASSVTQSTSTTASQLRAQPTAMTRVSRQPATTSGPTVPVRPVQASRVVSDTQRSAPQRPTTFTAGQEEKRPVPPLRTQRSIVSRPAPGPSSSSGAPHRIQMPSTTTKPSLESGSQPLPSTGPRRVPMPPPPPPPPKKETEGPKRPASKTEGASSSQRLVVPPAPVKKKSTPNLSSSVKDRVQASRPPISHTRTKSSATAADSLTASASVAAAAAAAAGSSVKPPVVPKAKPQWGRSAPNVKPVAGPSQRATAKPPVPVVKKLSSKIVPAPNKSRTTSSRKESKNVTPEKVPLPPSPTLEEEEAESIPDVEAELQREQATVDVEEVAEENDDADTTGSKTPIPTESIDEAHGGDDDDVADADANADADGAEDEAQNEETDHTNEQEQDETVSSSMTDTTAVHPSSINNKENIPVSEPQTVSKPVEVCEEDDDNSMIFSNDENPRTPQQGLLPYPSANDLAAAKTPISALLSSIERGFKYDYSPITPLSPADCYLPNINGATPYSHQTHALKGPMQPFNHALHAPGHSGIFGGFGAAEKPKEELVRGDIGVVQLSEYNKLYMTTSLPGLDDGRQTFIELNDN